MLKRIRGYFPALPQRSIRWLVSLLSFFIFSFGLSASSGDSLRALVREAKTDTARARVMLLLARELQYVSPNESATWADSALVITREKGPDELRARAAAILGNLNNGKGLYQLALKYFIESLAAFERSGNLVAQANVQNSMGNTYLGRKEYARALEAFRESARLAEQAGDLHMQAIANAGISNALSEEKPAEAIAYIQKSRQLFQQLGDAKNVAFTQGALGLIYYKLGQYDKAEAQQDSALAVFLGTQSVYMIFSTQKALGDVYGKTNRPEKALDMLFKSEAACRKMDAKDNLAGIYSSISEVYESMGDYRKSLEYFRLFKQYNDSVFNSESSRQLYEAQEAFGSEKKQREIEMQKEQLSQQAVRQNLLLGGIFLVMIFSFFTYRQYRAKRRANRELAFAYKSLESKNEEIALKNKEITDSIRYAKGIQESFLPDEAMFRSLVPESFLLYRPKDIVSGDFYWLNRVGDYVVFAVADCTGHGVPGAFLSAICNDLMNHVIRDSGIVAPEEILRRLDEKLRQLQGKSASSHDGMDVAICALHVPSGKLHFAGARRPLLIARNRELIEFEASKFSIGEQVAHKKFEAHTFAVQPGDNLYLFTDGFADQFGGPHGKKFKYRRFQELLQSISDQPMDRQCEHITQAFVEWRGSLEQVDDVCVMGIRV